MAYNYQNRQPQSYWQGPNQNIPIPQVRPVSSFEEVRAMPIDFDGSIFYFSDMANKRIYTKQIGADGSPLIYLYEYKEIQPTGSNYVTKEELDNKLKSFYEALTSSNNSEQVEQKKPVFEF